jgi:ribosomal protein S18 acetylase RimI-like enzyme
MSGAADPAIRVRLARPDDAPFLAWAMLAAGRGHLERGWYDIALGLTEEGRLELLRRLVLTKTPSWWRYDRFLVAEADGRPAAALSGFGANEYEGSQAALGEAASGLGWGEQELAAVWSRGSYVFTCTMGSDAPEPEAWTIENVATAPDHRGRRLAGRLIEAALARGRRAGFRQAQISFLIGNEPAERAYTRAGFRLAAERRHPDFEAAVGAPGLKKFVQDL